MSQLEEQRNELEALSEIYYNEIQVRSNESPISFSINIRPQASSYEEPELECGNDGSGDSDSDDEEVIEKPAIPSVELLFEFPETYPDVKPNIHALDYANLDEEEVNELLKTIDKKSEESLGSVMIFTLVSDIVEWLSSIAEREENQIELERTRKLEELDAEEKRKAEGTLVTVETFLAWKAKFEAELLKVKIDQQKKQTEQNPGGQRRFTGREMFEKDKALAESDLNFVDDLEQDQIEALMHDIDDIDLEDDEEEFSLGSADDDYDDEELSGKDDYNSDEG